MPQNTPPEPSSPSVIAGQIKRKSRNLGFADCRICSADPAPERDAAWMHEWLNQGMHGDMRWFERSKKARADIKQRYPWARSMIVLRYDYAADRPTLIGGLDPKLAIVPRVARYAQGVDYHDQLEGKLKKLQSIVRKFDDPAREEPGCEALWYQDTGPVLEHVYAARSGVGWTGKHTLTLDAQAGSYFFLAEIITSLELPHDPPASDHCGTCTACIDACPTDAIIEPYKLDARRCISYLSIEHKDAIEPAMRDQLHGLLFGCDICQEVCPYNAKRAERDGPRPPENEWRSADLEALSLDAVLTLRDARLEAALAGTPLRRTGAARLKRNAALIAGAEQLSACLKGLIHCLTHPEPMVRESCAWALGCFKGTKQAEAARKALVTHQKRESEEAIREVAITALERLTPHSATPEKRQVSEWAQRILDAQKEQ